MKLQIENRYSQNTVRTKTCRTEKVYNDQHSNENSGYLVLFLRTFHTPYQHFYPRFGTFLLSFFFFLTPASRRLKTFIRCQFYCACLPVDAAGSTFPLLRLVLCYLKLPAECTCCRDEGVDSVCMFLVCWYFRLWVWISKEGVEGRSRCDTADIWSDTAKPGPSGRAKQHYSLHAVRVLSRWSNFRLLSVLCNSLIVIALSLFASFFQIKLSVSHSFLYVFFFFGFLSGKDNFCTARPLAQGISVQRLDGHAEFRPLYTFDATG